MITSFFRSLILSMFVAMLMAGEPPSTASWEAFKATHVDALATFATSDKAEDKGGSLEWEVRQEAAAFAKKIDSKSAKLKNLFTRKRVMTTEEATADKALRATVAAREKARLTAEAATKNDTALALPEASNVAEEFERLRQRILHEQLAFALHISLDPDDQPVVVLRKSILLQIKNYVGQTRWAWEKAFKNSLERALLAKYEPWNFTWVCAKDGWGELTLTQDGPAVKGRWRNGTLSGQMKGRHLEGTWQGTNEKGANDKGTFTFTLGGNDDLFDARVAGSVGEAKHWNALRKDAADALRATSEIEEPEVKPEPQPEP
jgi:hypothetical protein